MLKRHVTAHFIVHDHRTDGIIFQLATHQSAGYAALFQIAEQVDIKKKPVRENDEPFNAPVEQHFQIALKAAAFIVYIGEDR